MPDPWHRVGTVAIQTATVPPAPSAPGPTVIVRLPPPRILPAASQQTAIRIIRAAPWPLLTTWIRTVGVRASCEKLAPVTWAISGEVSEIQRTSPMRPENWAGRIRPTGKATATASRCPAAIRGMVPPRRITTWPRPSSSAISTVTSRAVCAVGLLTTAKAEKPLGEAAAPTWSSASAGAGGGVGTGVVAGDGVLTGSVVGSTVVGDAACWQADSAKAKSIAICQIPLPPRGRIPSPSGGGEGGGVGLSVLISTRPPPCY